MAKVPKALLYYRHGDTKGHFVISIAIYYFNNC